MKGLRLFNMWPFFGPLRKSGLAAGLMALALGLPSTLHAESTGFGWTGALQFDPNRIISRKGGTLGQFMAEFYGPDAQNGAVEIRGHVTYETATPPRAASTLIAGYQTALTAVTVQIGAVPVEMDLPMVARNAATSQVGLTVYTNNSFCGDFEHCEMAGLPFSPWGNLVLVMDNTGSTLIDETGMSSMHADTFAFLMGRTAGVGEFVPSIQTTNFGVVSVDGMALGIYSVPGGNLYSGTALPHMRQFLGSTQIGRTEIWLYLEGPELIDKIKIEGVITGIDIDP